MHPEALLHLLAYLHHRVHAGHRLLKHHRQVLALDLAQLLFRASQDFPPGQVDAALHGSPLPGQQAADAHGCDRLSAAAFPHQTQNFARLHGKADTVYCIPAWCCVVEMDPQGIHLKQSLHCLPHFLRSD